MKPCWFCTEAANGMVASQREALACCRDCRTLASRDGREGYQTPKQLAHTVLQAFDRKYSKLLRMPAWDDWEIDALEDRLRQSVEASNEARRILVARRSMIADRAA
jgi:hypothetical protein